MKSSGSTGRRVRTALYQVSWFRSPSYRLDILSDWSVASQTIAEGLCRLHDPCVRCGHPAVTDHLVAQLLRNKNGSQMCLSHFGL